MSSTSSAEDLLQAAYLRLQQYEGPVRNPDAFLVRVALNLDVDERRRRRWIDERPVDQVCSGVADDTPLQDEVFAARERLRHANEALNDMPERTRTIFLQHRLEGLKYREIAERAGISQSAVEKHIARAVLLLAARDPL